MDGPWPHIARPHKNMPGRPLNRILTKRQPGLAGEPDAPPVPPHPLRGVRRHRRAELAGQLYLRRQTCGPPGCCSEELLRADRRVVGAWLLVSTAAAPFCMPGEGARRHLRLPADAFPPKPHRLAALEFFLGLRRCPEESSPNAGSGPGRWRRAFVRYRWSAAGSIALPARPWKALQPRADGRRGALAQGLADGLEQSTSPACYDAERKR